MKSFIVWFWIILLIGSSLWLRLPTDKYPIRENRELFAQVAIAILFIAEITGHLTQKRNYKNGWLTLFLGWILFSNIIYYQWWTMQALINVVLFTYLFITTIRYMSLIEAERILKFLCWLVIFQCGYCLIQLLQYDNFYFDIFSNTLRNRPVGTLENEAMFGSYLSFLIPLCFIWRKWKWNIAGIVAILFLIISQSVKVDAQSLTVFISAICGFGLFLFLRNKMAFLITIAVLSFGIIGAYRLGQVEIDNKVLKVWCFTKEPVYKLDLHGGGRFQHWKESLEMSRLYSWQGMGIGSYRVYMPQKMKGQTAKIYRQAHSEPVQIICELGIIGLIFYVLFITDIFKKMWKLRRHYIGQSILCGFVAFLINSITFFPIHVTSLICPIIFFIAITEIIGGKYA